MDLTPLQCLEKWEGREIRAKEGDKGCILILKDDLVEPDKKGKERPEEWPILTSPQAREILAALIYKHGMKLKMVV